jgi:hypothetical protein
MTAQTIPEYLEEGHQKATDTQLRTEEEAARIQPLQHGHHRTAKQPKVELLPPVKAASKKKKEEKDCCCGSQETTRLGKNGSENPQEGVTGLNRIQKIPQPYKT